MSDKRIQLIINENGKILNGFTYSLSESLPSMIFQNGKFVKLEAGIVTVDKPDNNLRIVDTICTDELYQAWVLSVEKNVFLIPEGDKYHVEYR